MIAPAFSNTSGPPPTWDTRAYRHLFNWWPCYRRSGGRVTRIAGDWHTIDVALRLGWRTRNYVGTIYGGSMYAAMNPMFMLMLMKLLGPGYVVWDKAAAIRFVRPGTGRLRGVCHVPHAEPDAIRSALETARSVERVYTMAWRDASGVVCAEVDTTVYIRRKSVETSGNAKTPLA